MRNCLIAIFAGATALAASETKVRLQELPEAVRQTVAAETKSATLRGLAKEVEKGKTYYEAETVVNGRSRDVLIDPSGKVVEVEEEVALAGIPEPARKALEKRGKVGKVESVTKGSTVTYEAVIEAHGKKSETAVSADGTLQ